VGTVDVTSLVGLAGTPLVLALVELIKQSWTGLPGRLVPSLVLAVAIALNVALALYLHTDPSLAVIVGMVTGLSASGLYSHVAATRG
jgi:hypothetical protein